MTMALPPASVAAALLPALNCMPLRPLTKTRWPLSAAPALTTAPEITTSPPDAVTALNRFSGAAGSCEFSVTLPAKSAPPGTNAPLVCVRLMLL